MIRKEQIILAQRKENLHARLSSKGYSERTEPMLQGVDMAYEISGRSQAISAGGIGAIHKLVERVGLIDALNEKVPLLQRHLPYFESDHILTLSYNVICGGHCLQDIDLLREEVAYLDALGAQRIPDPTTAGDFLRRFDEEAVSALQETINNKRLKVWRKARKRLGNTAIVGVDGTICPTSGECKQGMDISYKGLWGYTPLIISLANTQEILYLVNRPANQPAHVDAVDYIDQALELVGRHFKRIYLGGDADFSLTEHFDRWDEKCLFVFGFKAVPSLIEKAETLTHYQLLERKAKYEVKTKARKKPEKVKEKRVKARNYKRYRLLFEEVAEFNYRPIKCKKSYRMVVLRKHIEVSKGDQVLEIQIRYFFYITNDWKKILQEIVFFNNGRCNQENVIEQLKNGLQVLRMPVREFFSNWAYMVAAALAWNLKAWYALLCPDRQHWRELLGMEFKSFLNAIIRIPCQILKRGRQIVYRIQNYTRYTQTVLKTFRYLNNLCFT